MKGEHVHSSSEDGVTTITIDRPEVMNALSEETLHEITVALERVGDDGSARALILTGAGRAFCAGAELSADWSDVEEGSRDRGAILERWYNPILLRLRDLPCPIVAAVNGAAAGGGCALALAADITIAARSAFFLQPFTAIGLVPDVGSTWLLPRLVGRARAAGMMLLGERITAAQALDWGMIWDVVDDAALPSAARALATRLAHGPAEALRLTRLALWDGLEEPLAVTLQAERVNQRRAGRTSDHAEGVSAFIERRAPRFAGV